MKKRYFSAVLAVVLCLMLALTGCDQVSINDVKKDAATSVFDAIKLTLTDEMSSVTPFKAFSAAAKKGMLGINVSADDVTVDNKLYMDAEGHKAADIIDLTYSGETAGMSVYADSSAIAVQSEELFGDSTAYGMDLSTLKDDLKVSGIWEMVGTSYDEFYAQYGKMIDSTIDLMSDPTSMNEEMQKNVKQFSEDVKAILNASDSSVSAEKVTVNSEEINAIVVQYTFNEDTVKQLMNKLIDFYENVYSSGKIGSFYNDMLSVVPSEDGAKLDIVSVLGEARGEIDKALADITLNMTVKFAINPKNGRLASVDCAATGSSADSGDVSVNATIVLGADPAKSGKHTFTMNASVGEEKGGMTAEISRADDDARFLREMTVTLTENGESEPVGSFKLGFDLDKAAKTYKLYGESADSKDIPAGKASVTGTYSYTDTTVDMTVDKYELDIVNADKMSGDIVLSITARAGENVPDMPEFTNLVKMSATELNTFAGKVAASVQSSKLLALIGSTNSGLTNATPNYEDNSDFDLGLGDLTDEQQNVLAEIYGTYDSSIDYDSDGDSGDDDDYATWQLVNSLL